MALSFLKSCQLAYAAYNVSTKEWVSILGEQVGG